MEHNDKVNPFDITEEALYNLTKRVFEESEVNSPVLIVLGNTDEFMRKFNEAVKQELKQYLKHK